MCKPIDELQYSVFSNRSLRPLSGPEAEAEFRAPKSEIKKKAQNDPISRFVLSLSLVSEPNLGLIRFL